MAVARTKLTLRVDEAAIQRAKDVARARGTSVSRLVEGFLRGLAAGEPQVSAPLTPWTRGLIGALLSDEMVEADEQAYREYLETKHP